LSRNSFYSKETLDILGVRIKIARMTPQTLEDARAYRYGRWAGNEAGNKYTEEKCIAEVSCGGRSFLYRQCSKPISAKGAPFCVGCARKIANRKKATA
jgi:hypothetical protein